jgi:hypothetical protein
VPAELDDVALEPRDAIPPLDDWESDAAVAASSVL